MVYEKPLKEERLHAALLFALGLLQIAGFWFAGALVNGPGPLAIPQPDTPLYLQAARRVAQGCPFSFSAGSAVSTGSTTVLHPFLFAVPYLLGFTDDAFIACSFVLNAVFYLVFLFSWGAVIRRRIDDPLARLLAVLLLALFGQAAYAALALSDIGLWLAVSGLFAAGLATERKALYGTMLLLGPWIRPEGTAVVVAFAAVTFGSRIFKKESFRKSDAFLACAGVVSVLGVFALNAFLTGDIQFASVAKKGHFATRPFFAALYCSAFDFLRMAKAFCFGLADDPPRMFYSLPVFGAVAFWAGIVTYRWDDARKFIFPLAAVGGLATVATSGWQNTNVDRYVAWILPLTAVFSAIGYTRFYQFLKNRGAAAVMITVPVLFAAASSITFWALFHNASRQADVLMKFGRELDAVLPPRASVGITGNCGLAYPLKDRGLRTLYGIYSPEFEGPLIAYALETLKNRPETRFDYWVFAEGDGFPKGFEKSQGEPVLIGPDGLAACKADWSLFDRAAAEPASYAGTHVLKRRVDVGFPADERAADYETETRYGLDPLTVFQHVAELDGKPAYESGRVIWGFDAMSVPLEPGKDLFVVMRTIREKDAGVPTPLGGDRIKHFDFGPSPELNISVDGTICSSAKIDISESGFTDAVIRIPGSAIKNPVTRVGFLGDHIACCYWFYQ